MIAEAKRLRDGDLLTAIWFEPLPKKSQYGWEVVAEAMFDTAQDLCQSGEKRKAGIVLAQMAKGLETGNNPMEAPQFDKPRLPPQGFIFFAAQLNLGLQSAALESLAKFEERFQLQLHDTAALAEYWAYDGWTLVLGGCVERSSSKFDRAISSALATQPPSAACSALVKIATIMAAAGRRTDALRVLEIANGTSTDMSGALFSDRSGLVPVTSSRHSAIAAEWSDDLRARVELAHQAIQTQSDQSDVFLSDLLKRRGQEGVLEMLEKKHTMQAFDAVRAIVLEGKTHLFDVITLLCASAVEMSKDK